MDEDTAPKKSEADALFDEGFLQSWLEVVGLADPVTGRPYDTPPSEYP